MARSQQEEFEDIAFSQAAPSRVMTGAYIQRVWLRSETRRYGYRKLLCQRDKNSKAMENCCRIGEDAEAGDVVIERGAMMDHIRCGLLASIGKGFLKL